MQLGANASLGDMRSSQHTSGDENSPVEGPETC